MDATAIDSWPPDPEAVRAAVLLGRRDELEERALGAAASETDRASLLAVADPELYDETRAIVEYLGRFGRPARVSTFADEGIIGVRLEVGIEGLRLVFWIRDDEGYRLLIDRDTDALAPTRFARRTARGFGPSAGHLAALRKYLLSVATVILPGEIPDAP